MFCLHKDENRVRIWSKRAKSVLMDKYKEIYGVLSTVCLLFRKCLRKTQYVYMQLENRVVVENDYTQDLKMSSLPSGSCTKLKVFINAVLH